MKFTKDIPFIHLVKPQMFKVLAYVLANRYGFMNALYASKYVTKTKRIFSGNLGDLGFILPFFVCIDQLFLLKILLSALADCQK